MAMSSRGLPAGQPVAIPNKPVGSDHHSKSACTKFIVNNDAGFGSYPDQLALQYQILTIILRTS
jgi:hypothetical protein